MNRFHTIPLLYDAESRQVVIESKAMVLAWYGANRSNLKGLLRHPAKAGLLAMTFRFIVYGSSFNSLTITSGSILCIIAPKEMDSIFIPGQVKQPCPKYFSITLIAPGFAFRISPITISLLNFFSAILD